MWDELSDLNLTRGSVTDYRYCAETQYCSQEGSETGSTLPLYASDMVKD